MFQPRTTPLDPRDPVGIGKLGRQVGDSIQKYRQNRRLKKIEQKVGIANMLAIVNQIPAGYQVKKRGLLARGVGGVAGGGLGAAKGSVVGGAKGAVKGGLGGAVLGGLGGAAAGAIGGPAGMVAGGLGGAALGAGGGAALGGGVGAGIGGIKGGIRGMRQGGRKFKLSVNERSNMQTVCYVNNSEQRRVQTQMMLNRLHASMEPVEIITENKWKAVGQAVKLTGKALRSGNYSRAGRIAKGGLKEAGKSIKATGSAAKEAIKTRVGSMSHGQQVAVGTAAGGALGMGGMAAARRRKKK